MHFDDPGRGFSFRADGPLDMRMDPGTGRTAADLVASLGESDLADLLQRYGEERRARAIAREIVRARRAEPITSTGRLAEIVGKAVGARPWERIHPATRTFQALRIAVNDELGALEAFLGDAAGLLEPGARLCVISFHSLEDRIVKNRFREEARRGGVRLLTRRPVRPGPEEEGRNPRARSARLRAVERIAEET